MAENQERPIEKMLRQAGKCGLERLGSPLELHGANRRLLHDEISRCHKTERRRPLLRLWPRFAFGLGFAAVLALGIWILSPPRPGSHMAFKTAQAAPEDSSAASSVASESFHSSEPPAPVAGAALLATNSRKSMTSADKPLAEVAATATLEAKQESAALPVHSEALKDKRLNEVAVVENSAGVAGLDTSSQAYGYYQRGLPSETVSTEARAAKGTSQVHDTDSVAGTFASPLYKSAQPAASAAAPAASAPTAPGALAGSSPEAQTPGVAGGSLSSIPNRTLTALPNEAQRARAFSYGAGRTAEMDVIQAKKAAASLGDAIPALVNFRVEQNGRNIKIIGQDGTVYTGETTTLAFARRQILTRSEGPASAALAKPVESAIPFQAVGTNNLKQTVRISGQIVGGRFDSAWFAVPPSPSTNQHQFELIGTVELNGISTPVRAYSAQK